MDTNLRLGRIIIPSALVLMALWIAWLGFDLIQNSKKLYLYGSSSADKSQINTLCSSCLKDGYKEALPYFILSTALIILVVLLPRLNGLSLPGFSFTLSELKEQVDAVAAQNNQIQGKLADSGGGKSLSAEQRQEISDQEKFEKSTIAPYPDDPQKGKWGGLSKLNDRELSAVITKSILPGFYTVRLRVSGTDKKPLRGMVKFHLHNTFRNSNPLIAVREGVAELKLSYVYGAFTVGAEADNGKTKLELDLAELADAPIEFRNK